MRFMLTKRNGETVVIRQDFAKLDGPSHARALCALNDALDCVPIESDEHEASLLASAQTDQAEQAFAEGLSLSAMTAAQQRRLLAYMARKLGINVRP